VGRRVRHQQRRWDALDQRGRANDAATGLPTAILDGGPITAMRTAAVFGVAIRRFAPEVTGRATRR
jgi:ornithine cyclodeaminase/alanine dehydrogenase-like protein (mu-crystallin family)